jgi:hypothetical protein
MPDTPAAEDPLATLRGHVRSAQEAAERLAREAGRTPPNGWEPVDHEQTRDTTEELRGLVELVQTLRELLPEDLQTQLTDLVRQLLVVLRAVVDLLIARLERAEPASRTEAQDIPVL